VTRTTQLVGNCQLKSNKKQSYDVNIMLTVEGSTQVFTNTLDLKNPFFRYNGTTATPPGHFSESPTEYFINNYANSHFSNAAGGPEEAASAAAVAAAAVSAASASAPHAHTHSGHMTTTAAAAAQQQAQPQQAPAAPNAASNNGSVNKTTISSHATASSKAKEQIKTPIMVKHHPETEKVATKIAQH
jgi:histone-arginine methyltransferase CARM1